MSACSGGGGSLASPVTGQVVDIRATGGLNVESFVLRPARGEPVEFSIGALEAGSFPPSHLKEHQISGQPVRVFFRDEGDRHLAVRLEDG